MVIIMYICICNGITDNEIRNAIDSYHHELDIHYNDSLSNNHDGIINCNNDGNVVPLEQVEANLKMNPQDSSELDYIKEKLDFDFCCGKCKCMVNDIIHNYNKVDIES